MSAYHQFTDVDRRRGESAGWLAQLRCTDAATTAAAAAVAAKSRNHDKRAARVRARAHLPRRRQRRRRVMRRGRD